MMSDGHCRMLTRFVAAFVFLTLQQNNIGIEGTSTGNSTSACRAVRDHPEGDLMIEVSGCTPVWLNVRVCQGDCHSSATSRFPPGGQETHHSCSRCVPTETVLEPVILDCGSSGSLIKLVRAHSVCECRYSTKYSSCV